MTYRWNGDASASLVPAEGMDEWLRVVDSGGTVRRQRWRYPGRGECLACHNPDFSFALGFNTGQLNRSFAYAGGVDNQLRALSQAGFLQTNVIDPEMFMKFAHFADTNYPIHYRARSYLAANCAQCHQPGTWAAQGADWDARFTTRLADTRLLGRIVFPGSLDRSQMLTRLDDPSIPMPPIGTTLKNTNGIALLSEWITTFPPAPWSFQDIGNVGLEGGASVESNGFTISGSGRGYGAPGGDEFHFLAQPFSGNRQLMARLESQRSTHSSGSAGLMVRQAGTNEAAFMLIAVDSSRLLSLIRRDVPNGPAVSNVLGIVSLPRWLRLVKAGTELQAFHSGNGSDWVMAGTWNVASNDTARAGFAATAHHPMGLNTARFQNVSLSGISISAPNDSAVFQLPAAITITVDVEGADVGRRVEFFDADVKLGEIAGAANVWVWTNAPLGNHRLRAKLTANSGATLFSETIAITVTLPAAEAAYSATDVLQQGDWSAKYGHQGFWIAGYRTNLNGSVRGGNTHIWAAMTDRPAALRRIEGGRIAAAEVSTNVLTLDLEPSDGALRRVALYFHDWESVAREQHVRLIDPEGGRILDQRSIADFEEGVYVAWAIRGRVRVEIASLNSQDTVLSGVFLDSHSNAAPVVSLDAGAGSYLLPTNVLLRASAHDPDGEIAKVEFFANEEKIGEAMAPPYVFEWRQPLAGDFLLRARALDKLGDAATNSFRLVLRLPKASAYFYSTNEVTRGDWRGAFGSEGFNIIGHTEQYPVYAELVTTNAQVFAWSVPASEPRALQSLSGTERIAAVWYHDTGFDFSVNLRDGKRHLVSLYFWDAGTLRQQRVSIFDGQTGTLLDERYVRDFNGGKYFSWLLQGHTAIRITKIFSNPNLNGLFFDPEPIANLRVRLLSGAEGSRELTLTWDALPERTYRLQYATNLSHDSWQDLPVNPVKLNNTYQVIIEDLNDAARYYRLLSSAGEP